MIDKYSWHPKNKEESQELMNILLLNVMQDFSKYLATENADVENDMVIGTSCMMILDKEEAEELGERMMDLLKEYMGREHNATRQGLKLLLFAVPFEEKGNMSIDRQKE